MTSATRTTSWLGYAAGEIEERCSIPRLELRESVASTMDIAHELAAAGAVEGTVILAETQSAGRGRHGSEWVSGAGEGVWLSVVLRPATAGALEVLSLRLALRLAAALDPLVAERICVKWPNDLMVGGRKLAGILTETRWRGEQLDWVIVGVGLNLRHPERLAGQAAGVRPHVTPLEALEAVMEALRQPAEYPRLSESELADWRSRDFAAGRHVVSPSAGAVVGITASGELVIDSDGIRQAHRAGSLIFEGGT